ncbi:hypothetical protein HY839_01830 [Candidatus Azambacteria bacterium]|nr:hypothetical protein [Candidatus Azambacteria bacterium]
MFVSLKNIIPKAIEKHGIHKHIRALTEKENIEKTISDVVKRNVILVKHHGKKISVRGGNFSAANEIRLREEEIKKRLAKKGIHIDAIRCAL